MNLKLKYLKSESIDKGKWDTLVSQVPNSNVFCFSWYLDAFCEWDAIVLDDYKGAIALPRRKKYTLNILYQPNFIQKSVWFGEQLGDLGSYTLPLILKKHFSRVHFNTNIKIGEAKQRTNLTIQLDNDIGKIRTRYSRSLKRNIKKVKKEISITKESNGEKIINLYKNTWGAINPQLTDEDYRVLSSLICNRPENFVCYTAALNGVTLAGVILLYGKRRFHYIVGANSDEGKKENALSYLIDTILERHANTDNVFDFEGSSIPSVKSYYSSFGAQDEPFYEVKISKWLIAAGIKVYKRLLKS